VAYGALLGVFLLGVLTKKATEYGAWPACCADSWRTFTCGSSRKSIYWYVALGSITTFVVGYGASRFFARAAGSS